MTKQTIQKPDYVAETEKILDNRLWDGKELGNRYYRKAFFTSKRGDIQRTKIFAQAFVDALKSAYGQQPLERRKNCLITYAEKIHKDNQRKKEILRDYGFEESTINKMISSPLERFLDESYDLDSEDILNLNDNVAKTFEQKQEK